MAFFKDAGGSVVGGMGSIADMWGDGVVSGLRCVDFKRKFGAVYVMT